MARAERVHAACACEPDPDACAAEALDTRAEDACTLEAYRAVRASLVTRYACLAGAERDAAGCLATAECDGDRLACEAARAERVAGCPPADAGDARRFHHARFVCLGAPGCPALEASGEGPALLRGTIDAASRDDHDATCAGVGGRDVSIRFTAPRDGGYRFDTEGSSYDTVLSTYDDCGARFPDLCDDDDRGLWSRLSLSLDAGETVLLVVDAFDGGEAGEWVLNVEVTP